MQPGDRRRQQAALGYIELGMFPEAREELDGLSPGEASSAETHILRLHLAHCAHRWEEARGLARELRRRQPDEPEWAVMLAFATRRCEDIPAARRVLVEAVAQFPQEAVIHFNLACYACQLGQLRAARDHLNCAMDLDRSYFDLALRDSDLAPMHAELRAMQ